MSNYLKPSEMSNTTFDQIFDFLIENQQKQSEFSLADFREYIDKKESTAKTYLSKKLAGVYVKKIDKNKYVPINLDKVSKQGFNSYMSQKSKEVIDSKKETHERLKDRAIDSFFLAVEIYNRITQKNKNEAFSILIINSWELLLKSFIAKNFGLDKIYYKGSDKSLSISDCIKQVFQNPNDNRRRNLEKIIELRDKATHLLIPELNFDISRIFQSCVINFLDFLSQEFNDNLLYRLNPGFIALVIDQTNQPDFEKLSRNYGFKASQDLKSFLEKFKKEEKEINDIQFAVPIEYKLVLTKKVDESDIQLFKSSSGENKGVIIEVAKDIDVSHPLSRNSLTDFISEKCVPEYCEKFSTRDMDAIIFKEKIKKQKQSQYHYGLDSPRIHRYSSQFADYVINKIQNNKDYISNCRSNYAHYLYERRKK
jgi:hypothetical protein